MLCRASNHPATEPRAVAKLFRYEEGDGWAIHAFVYRHFQRHDIHAWGIRAPLLKLMDANQIEYLFFWDKERDRTYSVQPADIRLYGTMGEVDEYGGTVNVPEVLWQTIRGRVTGSEKWVPKNRELVLPYCVTPWPMPVTPIETLRNLPISMPPHVVRAFRKKAARDEAARNQLRLDLGV